MPAVKIGIQLSSLRLPLRKAIAAAGRLGASAVELDARGEIRPQDLGQTGLRELRRLLDEHDLAVCAVAFRTRRGFAETEELDRRVTATKEAMKFAADLRANVVINHVGHIPPDDSPEWKVMIESLSDLGRYGQRTGAVLAATTGTEGPAELARLLAALPEESIGVNLDPGSLLVHGHSPVVAVQTLGASIRHVYARDAVRDRAANRGLEVPLGRGSVDFPALLGALEERTYRGYFTVARDNSPDPQTELGAAVQYLRSL